MGKLFFYITVLSLFLTSCSNYTQNALLGDYQQPSQCPDGGCADTSDNPQGLSISSPGARINYKKTDQYVEFAGNCSMGNYKQNFILIKRLMGTSQFVADSTIYDSNLVVSYNKLEKEKYPRCVNGRYDFLIEKSYFSGATGSVKLQFLVMGCDGTCSESTIGEGSGWVNPGSAVVKVEVVCSEANQNCN